MNRFSPTMICLETVGLETGECWGVAWLNHLCAHDSSWCKTRIRCRYPAALTPLLLCHVDYSMSEAIIVWRGDTRGTTSLIREGRSVAVRVWRRHAAGT